MPVRGLWNPVICPIALLPYLAWAFSVDHWDERWPDTVKRNVATSAFYLHRHKGTLGGVRRVVEPLGYLIKVLEWWQNNDPPGTFRLDIGVLETDITEAMCQKMERMIVDANPVIRHLIGLNIVQDVRCQIHSGVGTFDGDILTVYPG